MRGVLCQLMLGAIIGQSRNDGNRGVRAGNAAGAGFRTHACRIRWNERPGETRLKAHPEALARTAKRAALHAAPRRAAAGDGFASCATGAAMAGIAPGVAARVDHEKVRDSGDDDRACRCAGGRRARLRDRGEHPARAAGHAS
ncbi:hypothetical protein ACVBGC_19250 [Burkholderia stagnalis]